MPCSWTSGHGSCSNTVDPERTHAIGPSARRWLTEEATRRASEQGRPPEEVMVEFEELLSAGWPLQYVLGRWSFRGIELRVDERALIPRPETELLVDLVLDRLPKGRPARALDLGTGTGAIALALVAERPELVVVATDVSAPALALARENAAALGMLDRVTLRLGSWYEAVDPGERFDVVCANPPYVSETEFDVLDPWIRGFEPRSALVPGPTGQESLTELLDGFHAVVGPRGFGVFEIGASQGADLVARAGDRGLRAEVHRDLGGRDRFLVVEPT